MRRTVPPAGRSHPVSEIGRGVLSGSVQQPEETAGGTWREMEGCFDWSALGSPAGP